MRLVHAAGGNGVPRGDRSERPWCAAPLVEAALCLLDTSARKTSTASAARETSPSRSSWGSNGESTKSATSRGSPSAGPSDTDTQAHEVRRTERLRDRAKAVVPAEPATSARLQPAELEIDVVVHDEYVHRVDLVEARGRGDRASRLVHVRLGLRAAPAGDPSMPRLGDAPVELRPKRRRRAAARARRRPSSRRCGGHARGAGRGCRDPRRADRASRRTRLDGRAALTTPRRRSSRRRSADSAASALGLALLGPPPPPPPPRQPRPPRAP